MQARPTGPLASAANIIVNAAATVAAAATATTAGMLSPPRKRGINEMADDGMLDGMRQGGIMNPDMDKHHHHAEGKLSSDSEDERDDEDDYSSNKRRRGARKFKDPMRPKKPVTPYLFFMKDVRDRVAASNSHLSFGDIGRQVGRLWASLPDETRQLYIARANADKDRYQMEMAYYERPRENGRGSRRKKDPKAPKKARSSYAFFMTSVRPLIVQANPGTNFGDIGRLVGKRWNDMTAEQRRPFEELAEGDKTRNELEMVAYLKARQEQGPLSSSMQASSQTAAQDSYAQIKANADATASAAAAAISMLAIPHVQQ